MRDKDWGKLAAKAAACMTPDLKLALHTAAFANATSMSAVIRHALEVELGRLRVRAERRAEFNKVADRFRSKLRRSTR